MSTENQEQALALPPGFDMGNEAPNASETATFTVSEGNAPESGKPAVEQPKPDDTAAAGKPSADEGDEGKGKADDDAGDEGEDLPDHLPKNIKRRVRRANRQRDEANARLAAAERELAELKGKPAPAAPEPEPHSEDFDSYDDWHTAHKAWKAKKDTPAKVDDKKAEPKGGSTPLPAELVGAIGEVRDAVSHDHPDLWNAVQAHKELQISSHMVHALAEADHPETVLQAFIDNPALSKEIAALSPTAQAKRIFKLDAPYTKKAAAKQEAPVVPPVQRRDPPPEPIAPIDTKAATSVDLRTASFSDYERERNKQEESRSSWNW